MIVARLSTFFLTLVVLPLMGAIEIIPVEPTPEGKAVTLKLLFPRPYENKTKSPINIQLRVQGVKLGETSAFSRANQIYNYPDGQGVNIVIDNLPSFSYNKPTGMTSNLEDQLLSFSVPFTLKPGMHVIRCFPVRSYGESFKNKDAFVSEIFYFQDQKRLDTIPFDRFKPYLTYNEPEGRYPAHRSDPLLLDFYVSNCKLSPTDYKVRISIDGKEQKVLTSWVPYYIKGLQQGSHVIQLELLDPKGMRAPGSFNVVQREIVIDAVSPSISSPPPMQPKTKREG